jgi:hypothetical protein
VKEKEKEKEEEEGRQRQSRANRCRSRAARKVKSEVTTKANDRRALARCAKLLTR